MPTGAIAPRKVRSLRELFIVRSGYRPVPMTETSRAEKETGPVRVGDRAGWRRWLEENHRRPQGVWLVVAKKDAPEGITYEEAVEEALCFGWIDSTARANDRWSYLQRFSPRRRGSAWSRINRERVARLAAQGRMTPTGLAKVEEAKRDGSWDRLEAVEAGVVPDDLAAALEASPAARAAFNAYTASRRKQLLWWLATAKRDQTRRRRVEEIVRAAEQEGRSKATAPR
jgi:uncharacterized protein YdeI (YjbR/CyaY-like superfamily)